MLLFVNYVYFCVHTLTFIRCITYLRCTVYLSDLTELHFLCAQHNCDLINMSYGEPALLPDYGRFVDLVNEVKVPKLHL